MWIPSESMRSKSGVSSGVLAIDHAQRADQLEQLVALRFHRRLV